MRSPRTLRLSSRSLLLIAAAPVLFSACDGLLPEPPTTAVVEGSAPTLVSWSGAAECCGEDPHAVHGAMLEDGSVVMVGKAGIGADQTAGFITRWAAPQGPSQGRFVDDDPEVIRATASWPADSALLQVVDLGTAVVAVGFQAASASAPARGIAVAFDPTGLEVLSTLEVVAPSPQDSAALESALVTSDGRLVLGGSRGFSRDALEGFKSYGNLVGGRGMLLSLDPAAWLDSSDVGDVVEPEDIDAVVHEVPEVFSIKSMSSASSGWIAAVGSDEDEVSGLVVVESTLMDHQWYAYEDGFELTDVTLLDDSPEEAAILLSGHGGDGRIDGHVKRVRSSGEVLWATSFGGPGLDSEDTPAEGLAPDRFIFNECWGVVAWQQGSVLACGTGIEGCDAVPADPAERALCRTDPRRIWRSYLVGVTDDGVIAWSRAEGFTDAEGESAESAAEFVIATDTGTLYSIVDHDFGVGLARLEASGDR